MLVLVATSFDVIVGHAVLYLIFGALLVFVIASWWVLYTKMGEPGWKCLIPFYGEYVLFKRVWSPGAYVGKIIVFVVFLFAFFYIMSSDFVILAPLASMGPGNGIVVGVVLMLVSEIALLAISFVLNYKIAMCFGHGIGYCLGITFVPVVFIPILAFGDSRFNGVQEE